MPKRSRTGKQTKYGTPDAENPEWTKAEIRTAKPGTRVFRGAGRDENQSAFDAVQRIGELTGEPRETLKNPAAVALGRLGGLKGGKARAAKLTAAQRRKSAMKAAQARWSKKPY
jgi:hypothetical protein